jgi:hypothetical protein
MLKNNLNTHGGLTPPLGAHLKNAILPEQVKRYHRAQRRGDRYCILRHLTGASYLTHIVVKGILKAQRGQIFIMNPMHWYQVHP